VGFAAAPFLADELSRRAVGRGPAGQLKQMPEDIPPALSALAGLLLFTESFTELLQAGAELAVRAVDSVWTCGITLSQPGRIFTVGAADELARVNLAVEETLHHVLALGGTVAAEHGIGKLKRKWLPLQATPLEIAVMRGLKNALDPSGLMAPGNVL